MYDEIWTAGKAMYKLEPVLADGGELIIYAPHVREVCVTHRETIMEIGYHCRDYYLKQWDRFRHHPWGVLAHSSHVFGLGTFENGKESARARVTLATAIRRKYAGASTWATAIRIPFASRIIRIEKTTAFFTSLRPARFSIS
jgi:hypothetical protein